MSATPCFMTPDAFLTHWQGHRRLTRRVLEAFPDDQLFSYAQAPMRTFGEMAGELMAMAAPSARGLATGDWLEYEVPQLNTKAALLAAWDEATEVIDRHWAQIPPERFGETLTAFGQYTDRGHNLMLYVIDNEIHHRAQGYVYLRALGVEPPPFWER